MTGPPAPNLPNIAVNASGVEATFREAITFIPSATATSLAAVTPRSTPIVVVLTTSSSILCLPIEVVDTRACQLLGRDPFEETNTTLVAKPRHAFGRPPLSEPGRSRPQT